MNMNIDMVVKTASQAIFIFIAIVFLLASCWEFLFMLKTKSYNFETIGQIIATLTVSIVYGYSYIGVLTSPQFDKFSPYAATFIRPAILFLGCVLAAASRRRYILIKEQLNVGKEMG